MTSKPDKKPTRRRPLAIKTEQVGIGAAALLSVLGSRAVHAQEVLAPGPRYAITPLVLQPYETNATDVFAPSDVAAAAQQEEAPALHLGPLSIQPHVFYRFDYGTGIPAAGMEHVKTTIQDFSPGVLLNLGRHWTLDYTPTWRFYSSSKFDDTLDHAVTLAGGTTYENWVLGFSQSYVSSSTPLVETGTQTEQQSYITSVNATYHFNNEMWMDLDVNQNITDADQFASHREWSTLDWLNYDFWERLTAGVGLGLGYVNMLSGSDNVYEQLQARVAWRATDKVSFLAHAGLEIREFLGGGSVASTNSPSGSGTLVSPVAGGTIQYQPFDATKVSFDISHATTASYFVNQVTETTDIVGGLDQHLFGIVSLDLSGGYHRVEYIAAGGSGTVRTDNFFTFDSRLSCPFLKHGTAAAFYQYSDNSSTAQGFTFSSNQVGFELGYNF